MEGEKFRGLSRLISGESKVAVRLSECQVN